MAQSLIACPLCSTASFSSTNSLCLSLVNVTCKWIRCTMCEEELRGLDKFTIHLLSHFLHTPEFQRHLITENMPEPNGTNKSEPLNLVKDLEQRASETSCSSQEMLNLQNIDVIENIERPSLKIDDEVMIFFNSNDKVNEISKIAQDVPQQHLESCAIELPKITINVNRIMDHQDENVPNKLEKPCTVINYFDESTRSIQQSECFVPTKPNDLLMGNTCLSVVEGQVENEKLSTHKKNKTDSTLSNTNCMDFTADSTGSTLENLLENHSGSRSSYLSPKGERVMGYRCDICSLVFPDEHILLMHRQLIHIELGQDPSKAKNYKCHLCSKSFVMKGSLMVHMRVAHFGGAVVARLVEAKQLETNAVSPESAQYTCSVCNKGFRKEQQLIQHEKLHDGKQCNVCFKTFTTKYFLRKHMRLHTGEMPYSCKTCNKSFTFQQSYHKHLLYHNDDKPYTCTDCGRAFKELSTLHNHQRIHTGEKPFSCETCGKSFRQRVSYLVHRRIHTGVMPYRCQDCGKTFRYKVSERTHKCMLSTPGNSNDISDQNSNDNQVMNEETTTSLKSQSRIPDCIQSGQKDWNEKHNLEQKQTPSNAEQMNSLFPETADFFSLVMSPSDRMQQLSLSADPSEEGSPQQHFSTDNIDTETLKQLLNDMDDYT